MDLFRRALERHRDELNSLNVYPVPDGDTGTNMLLTQRAVTSALESSSVDGEFEVVIPVVSRASLMGARGNSGVILSQMLRGICEVLPARGDVNGKHFAAALEHATHEAYLAVTKPAEGTMLTVLRDAKTAARTAAKSNPDCGAVLTASLVAARESLKRTQENNDDLRRAGVVDAGGKGIVLLLDALRSAVIGEPMTDHVEPLGPVGTEQRDAPQAASRLTYEVQYLLEGHDEDVPPLRQTLGSLGESVVVVGGGGLFNVHVHTNEPDSTIQAGQGAGVLRSVSVVSLADQVDACMAGQARAVRVAEETSMVAVADGDGLVRAFESLGALVVGGGPGNNPSVSDLITAINLAPADAVVILPNHRNVVPAAERAATESSKRAVVIPSRSVPAGLSAAATFNPAMDVEENLRSMKEVLAASRSGEISRAERDAETPAGSVRRGDWIGVAEGEAVYGGRSVEEAGTAVAGHLVHPDAELLTLVVGSAVRPEQEQAVRAALARAHPDLRIEVVAGGEPLHPFLVGVE